MAQYKVHAYVTYICSRLVLKSETCEGDRKRQELQRLITDEVQENFKLTK